MKKYIPVLIVTALIGMSMGAVAHESVDVGDDTYYVEDNPNSDFDVYQETNGCEGLQEEPSDCDGDDEVEEADEQVFPPTLL